MKNSSLLEAFLLPGEIESLGLLMSDVPHPQPNSASSMFQVDIAFIGFEPTSCTMFDWNSGRAGTFAVTIDVDCWLLSNSWIFLTASIWASIIERRAGDEIVMR